jgi:hypothetical protein
MQVFCSRAANSCQLFPTDQIADCVSSGVTACCGGACGRSVISTQAEIDVCVADLDAASCATLDVVNGGALPASCQGVVRSALTTNSSGLLSGTGSTPERAGRMISD